LFKNNERGATEGRQSALWGTGSRGGDRSSVLWGKGGRGILVSCVAAFALAAPVAASAGHVKAPVPAPAPVAVAPATTPPPTGHRANSPDGKTWVAKGLLNKASSSPNTLVDVIVQSSDGLDGANRAMRWLGRLGGDKNLGLVGGVEVSLPARLVAKLATVPGLMITPNATVKVSGGMTAAMLQSTQLWPYESGNANLWPGDQSQYAGKTPAIAIVDSGIQARSDFGSRVIASVNLSTIAGNTATDPNPLNDLRGHGTFVAGIAAGSAPNLVGASPGAPLVSVKVMNDQGMAKTSDVIAACQWILDNKAKYNIRVANFSLHSGYSTNFYRDPLDQAVEKLWFNNVVVVAAAGNYGTAAGPSGVLYAPGNDPFVITVGAVDIGTSPTAYDDTVAPFSAYGYTHDGFYKPDVSAPGRYMVGPIPATSTIASVKAANLVGTDRIQLSGTSFSAPVVSGTVADMLARHPNWSPDQVKGALMRTARTLRNNGNPKAAGLGEITATRAVASNWTPNPNKGLERFVKTSTTAGAGLVFDSMSWSSAAKADMSWNSMSWADQSWSDQSWSDQAYDDMSWADQSWSDMSWTDMSWTDMSWTDMSAEDAAEGDATSLSSTTADASDIVAAASDPDTDVSVDGLSATAALGVPDPTVTVPAVDPTTLGVVVVPAVDPTAAVTPAVTPTTTTATTTTTTTATTATTTTAAPVTP
jgi:serine protease AprX